MHGCIQTSLIGSLIMPAFKLDKVSDYQNVNSFVLDRTVLDAAIHYPESSSATRNSQSGPREVSSAEFGTMNPQAKRAERVSGDYRTVHF